jgi:hypothetical protein
MERLVELFGVDVHRDARTRMTRHLGDPHGIEANKSQDQVGDERPPEVVSGHTRSSLIHGRDRRCGSTCAAW